MCICIDSFSDSFKIISWSFGFLKVVLHANWGFIGVFIFIGVLSLSWICGFVSMINLRNFLGTCFIFLELSHNYWMSCSVSFLIHYFSMLIWLGNFFVFNAFCSYRHQALMSFSFLASVSFEFDFDRIWLKKNTNVYFVSKQIDEIRRYQIQGGTSHLEEWVSWCQNNSRKLYSKAYLYLDF